MDQDGELDGGQGANEKLEEYTWKRSEGKDVRALGGEVETVVGREMVDIGMEAGKKEVGK